MCTRARASCVATILLAWAQTARAAADDNDDQSLTLSKPPAVIALLLYLSVAIVQWLQWWRNGRKSLLVIPIGMTCYAIGMILRAGNNYAWQFLFTFLSPCAFLAACYIILSNLAASIDPRASAECLIVNRKLVSWGFILSDLVTFCTQCAGTVFVILGGDWLHLGEALAIGGLCLALVSFVLFSIIAWIFAQRLRSRYPAIYHPIHPADIPVSRNPFSRTPINNPRLLFRLLAISCIGILIRSVFRLIEQSTGFFGPIARQEALFYIFDSLPLWIAMLVWTLVWPKRFFIGSAEALGGELGHLSGTSGDESDLGQYGKARQGPRGGSGTQRDDRPNRGQMMVDDRATMQWQRGQWQERQPTWEQPIRR